MLLIYFIYFGMLLLMLIAAGVRWLRWLAIIQQKEYRLDRLVTYGKSQQGLLDLFKFWPSKKDFTRTGLKRPVRTQRLVVILVTSVCLIGVSCLIGFWADWNWLGWWLWLLLIWLFVPIITMMSIWPTVMISQLTVFFTLLQASQKVRQDQPYIIGITGSYGKTSTKLLLAYVLSGSKSVFVTPHSYNTRYSVARSIVEDYHHQELMVLEYGAYKKGEIKALTQWFSPQMGIITGLAPQHLRLFGSVDNIVAAKSELLKALPEEGPVFCNAQDLGAVAICQAGGKENFIAYSGENSKVELENVSLNTTGYFKFDWKGKTIQTQLVGTHYASATAAAIAVGLYFNQSEEDIQERLQTFIPSNSFIKIKNGRNQSLVIDDGRTSNSLGFQAALELLAWHKQQSKRTWLITAGIIDLGEKSAEIHQSLAQAAVSVVDQVIYLGQEGRSEFLQAFGKRLVALEAQTSLNWDEVDDELVILIEGKVPAWIYQELGIA